VSNEIELTVFKAAEPVMLKSRKWLVWANNYDKVRGQVYTCMGMEWVTKFAVVEKGTTI
jgi:hypothetical protein